MRLLIDDSIELNQTDEKNFAGAIERLTWLGKHAPDGPVEALTDPDALTTCEKASKAAELMAEVLGEIKKK